MDPNEGTFILHSETDKVSLFYHEKIMQARLDCVCAINQKHCLFILILAERKDQACAYCWCTWAFTSSTKAWWVFARGSWGYLHHRCSGFLAKYSSCCWVSWNFCCLMPVVYIPFSLFRTAKISKQIILEIFSVSSLKVPIWYFDKGMHCEEENSSYDGMQQGWQSDSPLEGVHQKTTGKGIVWFCYHFTTLLSFFQSLSLSSVFKRLGPF